MTIKIDDAVLDELVMGDVSPDRYRQILNQLDAEPDQWRACAIAFLQEQAIEAELKSLSGSSVDWSAAHRPEADALEREETLVYLNERSQQNHVQPASSEQSYRYQDPAAEKLLRLGHWTSLAALLLVSFTIGWIGSGVIGESTQAGNSSDGQGTTTVSQDTDQNYPNDGRYGSGGGFETLPSGGTLVRGSDLGKQYFPIDRSVPEWLVELERRGLVRIESSDGIVPMQLENGNQVVIPTQMYRVVRNGQSY